MSAAVSTDLRRMTSQPTITLSAPAPHHPKPVTGNSGKGPALASANATPKQTSPGPLLTSSGQPHATPARSQSIPSSPTSMYVNLHSTRHFKLTDHQRDSRSFDCLCNHLCRISTKRHSSSSAIFERDIEPINFQSSPLKNADPHHTSRAQVHESTEQAVPSVLTSAVSALSLSPSTPGSPAGGAYKRHSIYDDGEISVISPAPAVSSGVGASNGGASLMLSGMATPRSMSRSPSPPATATFASTSQSYHQQSATGATSPVSILAGSSSRRSTSPRPATDATASSPPSSFKPVTSLTGDNTNDVTEAGSQSSRADPINPGSPIGGFVVGSGPIPRTRPSQASLVTPVGGPENFAADEALSTSSPNNRLSFISYHVRQSFSSFSFPRLLALGQPCMSSGHLSGVARRKHR